MGGGNTFYLRPVLLSEEGVEWFGHANERAGEEEDDGLCFLFVWEGGWVGMENRWVVAWVWIGGWVGG